MLPAVQPTRVPGGRARSTPHPYAVCRTETATLLNARQSPIEPVRVCWIVELLLSLEPGQFVKQYFGPTQRQSRIMYEFHIWIPEVIGTSPVQFAKLLHRVLSEQDLGKACVGGAYISGGYRETEVDATIRGDLDRALRLIRETLIRHQTPEGTRIELVLRERRKFPLHLDSDRA